MAVIAQFFSVRNTLPADMASLLALFLGLGLATAEEIHLVRRSKQPRSGGEVASLNMITSASTAPFGETKISTSDNGAAADFTPRDHAAAVGFTAQPRQIFEKELFAEEAFAHNRDDSAASTEASRSR